MCQQVEVLQGYEYTFTAYVMQYCVADPEAPRYCYEGAIKAELSIGQVYRSGQTIINNEDWFQELTGTFEYVDPSIDSTDLCIVINIGEGDLYNFWIDSVSLGRGKAVPIPEEED
jgi:hypothetical protein